MIEGDIELREIRVFLAVADALHFGRAAERVGLTPSRVSQTIRILEARLGGPLFERTSRRVQLTPIGRQLAQSVQPPYEALERALIATREAATGISGSLRVKVRHWLLGGPHLTEIVKTFEDRYPACSVELTGSPVLTPTPAYVELYDGVDVTAIQLPFTDPNVTIGPILSRQGRVVAVSASHPLAHREHVSYEEVADYVVADTPEIGQEVMDTFIPPRTPAGRHLTRRAFRNYMALEMAVARGEVIDIALENYADYARHPNMKFIPISDLAPKETAWAWLSTNQNSKIEAFARVTEEVLASYSREAQAAESGTGSMSGLASPNSPRPPS